MSAIIVVRVSVCGMSFCCTAIGVPTMSGSCSVAWESFRQKHHTGGIIIHNVADHQPCRGRLSASCV